MPLHVSVDIDSLDPWFVPSTGTPVLGGLTLTELMYIGNTIHDTGFNCYFRLLFISFVEIIVYELRKITCIRSG